VQYNILKDEIQNDPLGIGYSTMDENAIMTSLNAATRAKRVLVPIWKIKKHAIENGYWVALRAVADDSESPLHAVATLTVDYIGDERFENLDMDLTSTQTLLGGLVAGGIITQSQADDLFAMGDEFQSRATELGLPTVNLGHLEIVRG
jgi:hypothetical protein